ncbi:MAG: IS66 family transposase [Acidobacteria bacterium]|nr:IS66 family transposase [Acidobacteriota bacterium]
MPDLDNSAVPAASVDVTPADSATEPKERPRGHGRRSASSYTGAQVVSCEDPALKPGDRCPQCPGHLYDTKTPTIFIHLTGQPIVAATRYDQQVLRCSSCQTRFTAPLPEGVPPQKYDSTADVAIAVAKYAGGIPSYRLARLQESCGVPLSESVQFERCERVADAALPVFLELQKEAACGEVLFADDTRVKILDCVKENKSLPDSERRGLQTTGIVARVGGKQIALYRSGRQHAGENIDRLLEHRLPELAIPIQAGDAISANWSRKSETIPAKCLAHARRQFVEIEESFPRECGRVLDAIGEVYENDRQTKQMAPAERLQFHQQHSGPVMEELRAWIDEQFWERNVEPNSALGHALSYMKRHWEELTQFLRTENAPLDNNPAERSLRRAVLLRKNALFYKTEHGAAIGDILLSVIETCRLNHVNAWDYLVCVVRQARSVRRDPALWLPWNYARGEPTRLVA